MEFFLEIHTLWSFLRCNWQVGYKELCIHMASDHGGLEEVMANDEREGIRDLVEKIRR